MTNSTHLALLGEAERKKSRKPSARLKEGRKGALSRIQIVGLATVKPPLNAPKFAVVDQKKGGKLEARCGG